MQSLEDPIASVITGLSQLIYRDATSVASEESGPCGDADRSDEIVRTGRHRINDINSIVKVKGGRMDGWLAPKPDMKMQDELFERDEKGDYKDTHISAMWFGFQLGLKARTS